MSSDEEAVGQKRKLPERSTRANRSKSRRVIEEDSDEEENTFDEPEGETEKKAADNISQKLLCRLKKSSERRKEQERKAVEKKKKEQEKPKKPSEPLIPKKTGIPRKSSETTKKEATSLLSGLKVPPSAPNAKVESSSQQPPTSQPKSIPKTQSKTRPELTQKRKGPVSTTDQKQSLPPQAYSGSNSRPGASTPNPNPAPLPSRKSNSNLQSMVWKSLSELCNNMATVDDKPFLLAPEQSGSSSMIDLSGSMLKYREYDWFDVDDAGAIVVQPKIPIFPEDFPPGMPEWPLSWWGIVDPALGERKDRKVVYSSGVTADAPRGGVKEGTNPGNGSGGPPRSSDRGDQERTNGRGRGDSRDRSVQNHIGHPDHRVPPHAYERRGGEGYGPPPSDYRGPPPPGYRGSPPHGHRRPPDFDARGPPPPDYRGPGRYSDERGPYPEDRLRDDDRRRHSSDRGPPRRPDGRGPPRHPDDRGPPRHPDDRGPGRYDRHAPRPFDDRGHPRHPDDRGSRYNSDSRGRNPDDGRRYMDDSGPSRHSDDRRRHSDERRRSDDDRRRSDSNRDDRRSRPRDDRRG